MTAYRNAPNSGVASFVSSPPSDPQKWIDVTFHNGVTYRYGDGGRPADARTVMEMKTLGSLNGQGLCRFITRNRL
jgi:hypothetical protein